MHKGAELLVNQVLEKGYCTGCGMCAGLCPFIRVVDHGVGVLQQCGVDDSKCALVCPRVSMNPAELDMIVFDRPRRDLSLGVYTAAYYARSTDKEVQRSGQYGGSASSLILASVEAGIVREALVTAGEPLDPSKRLVHDRAGVLSSTGSKYFAYPTLEGFYQHGREDGPWAVLGRPCQVTALRKAQHEVPERLPNPAIVIGLFCFWALDKSFASHLRNQVCTRVLRVDLPPEGSMVVETKDNIHHIPLEEVRSFIRPACHTCWDSTAEWADVSVGATEHREGWNTLIVRSVAGEKLVRFAVEAGFIEIEPFPAERLDVLRLASGNKKRRLAKGLQQGGEELEYLHLTTLQIKELLEGDSHGGK